MFINGISKLKLQMIFTGIGAVVFIPTAYIFTNYLKLGVEGVIYAMIISNLYHPIIAPLQYYKIISGKAKGIWIK